MHRCRWVIRACAAVVLILPVVLPIVVGLTTESAGAAVARPAPVGGSVAAAGSRASATSGASSAAAGPRLTPKLTSITSSVTASTKDIAARGRVANTGGSTVTDVKASFWIAPRPITSRAELTTISRAEVGSVTGDRVTRREALIDDVSGSLRPGASAGFDVRVPASELIREYDIDRPGIYLVGVDVRGYADGSRETWKIRTFQPWIVTPGKAAGSGSGESGESGSGESGKGSAKPVNAPFEQVEVSYILPIAAPSELVGDGYLLDEKATRVLAPDGRLSRLLDLGAKYDLSFLVDPAVLELANEIQRGYRIVGEKSTDDEHHAGEAGAGAFYDKARGLLAAHDTHMLPYADPDLPALQRHKMTGPYAGAIAQAKKDAAHFKTSGSVVSWPGNGFASSDMLDTVDKSGGNTVLLRRDALPDIPTDGSSPVVSMSVPGGNLNGLVADPSLTAAGRANDRSTLQMRQRFLSETALLALRPSTDKNELRRVIAAFDRNWDPGRDGDAFFDAAAQAPWLGQLSVGSLLTQSPTAYGGSPYYPAADAKAELGKDIIDLLSDLSEQSSTYVDLLATRTDRSRAADEQRRAFLRASSTSWRTRQGRDEQLVSRMYSRVLDINTQKVGLAQVRTITMPAGEGRFPVTIANHHDRPIRVQLAVSPRGRSGSARVKIQPITPVVIGPGRKATVSVQAEGPPGTVTLRAQLHTVTTSDVVGPVNTTFQVNIKNFGPVGWGIIGAGVGLLLLAVAFRLVRRLRGTPGKSGKSGKSETSETSETAGSSGSA